MTALEFFTDADLGNMLGLHESQVRRLRQRYGWPHVKVGREVRYTADDITAITRLHHVGGAQKPKTLPGQTALSARRSA